MADWPIALPQSPLIKSFREETPDTVIRTQMDVGADKIRRRSTVQIRKFEMQFIMDDQQVEILENFYHNTLGGGTQRFTFKHPRTKEFSDRFRITGAPSYSSTGNAYIVTIGMELLAQ